MMKRKNLVISIFLCLLLMTACTNKTTDPENTQKRPDVTFDEMTFTVNNKTFDLTEQETMANAILSVTYVTDSVFVLECHINPDVSYYALFDTSTMDYYDECYGTNLTWMDDDLDSVIYANENTITSLNEQVLFSTELTDTQYISNVTYTDNGKTVDVTISDTAIEDENTLSFEH